MGGTAAEQRARIEGRNPFPSVPVVQLGYTSAPIVNIETDALAEARLRIHYYLGARGAEPSRPRNTGQIVPIIGDLGTGKSHIAAELIAELQMPTGSAAAPVIVVTACAQVGDSLVDIYQRLFRASGEDGRMESGDAAEGALLLSTIDQQVGTLLAELQEERKKHGIGSGKSGLTLLPFPDVNFVQNLQNRLSEITGDDACAKVLSLLRHKEDQVVAAASAWLRADELSGDQKELLADRGVPESIATDERALTVFNALSLLFGNGGQRLVLVIDEIHHLWRDDRSSRSVTNTLLPLLESVVGTGVLLIVCGLSDFWRALPEGFQQRFGEPIKPSALSSGNIREYIKRAQGHGRAGRRAIEPFTDPAVESLYWITGGHPRKTVAICHHAYRRYLASGKSITERDIREASRHLAGPETVEEVKSKILELCGRLGYRPARPERSSGSGEVTADIWLPARTGNERFGVVVSQSVVDEGSARSLIQRGLALAWSAGDPTNAVALVVIGLLAVNIAENVKSAFACVLFWGNDEFPHGLTEAIEAYMPRRANTEDSSMLALREEIRGLRVAREADRQILESLLERMPATRTPRPDLPTETGDMPVRLGSTDLDRRFADTSVMIHDAITRATSLWEAIFREQTSGRLIDRSSAPGSRLALPEDLSERQIIQATGVLLALDRALRGFATGVAELVEWSANSNESIRQELGSQRDRFDEVADALLHQMPSDEDDANRTMYRVLGIDQRILATRVKRLGSVVYDTIYRSDFRSH
jgi:hypothetical protein